jgi:hypothetical protein
MFTTKLKTSLIMAMTFYVAPLQAQGEVVDNTTTLWTRDVQSAASIEVTTNNPRLGFANLGNGSLEMSTTGNLNDWAFFRRDAQPLEQWGTLKELTTLSFDWFRPDIPNAMSTDIIDWPYKSPVFRVGFVDGSEMVWENYFNTSTTNVTPLNQWIVSDILSDVFWYRNDDAYGIITGGPCEVGPMKTWEGIAKPFTINELINCFGNNTISSVSVGVGSQWPYAYRGYVDNVRVGFNGNTTVNANFDFPITPVPEPRNVYLFLSGLAAILWSIRRRNVTLV